LQVWTQNGFISSATIIVPESNTSLPVYPISASLYNAFEPEDLRKSNWVATSFVTTGNTTSPYYYLNKYKNRMLNTSSPEYLMVLRLGEQYLIRAEARAQQGKTTGTGSASEDLNIIRSRAGLQNTSASTQAGLLTAIYQERRVELFGEWGNRFLDLKRNGQLNSIIGSYKTTWLPTASLLPIPQNELTYDSNLLQNPGYH
jgi:starch-binding outer membrane protein, SusD/RagB family